MKEKQIAEEPVQKDQITLRPPEQSRIASLLGRAPQDGEDTKTILEAFTI